MHYTVFIDLYYLIILKFHKLKKENIFLHGNLGYEAINKQYYLQQDYYLHTYSNVPITCLNNLLLNFVK